MDAYFDGQPFGFSFAGTKRVGDAPGAYGPPDEPEDNRLVTCRCGIEHPQSAYFVAHDFAPCPAFTEARRSA